MEQKKIRKVFKRVYNCTICHNNMPSVTKINWFGSNKYICNKCIEKIANILNITVTTFYKVLKLSNAEVLNKIEEILNSPIMIGQRIIKDDNNDV